jgi:hypothetical protein
MVTDNEVCAELAVDIATPSLRRKELSGPADREAKTNRKVPIANGGKACRQQRKENADMTLIAKSLA